MTLNVAKTDCTQKRIAAREGHIKAGEGKEREGPGGWHAGSRRRGVGVSVIRARAGGLIVGSEGLQVMLFPATGVHKALPCLFRTPVITRGKYENLPENTTREERESEEVRNFGSAAMEAVQEAAKAALIATHTSLATRGVCEEVFRTGVPQGERR